MTFQTPPPNNTPAAYATAVQTFVRAAQAPSTDPTTALPNLDRLAHNCAEMVCDAQSAWTWYPTHRALLVTSLCLWGCRAAARAVLARRTADQLRVVVNERSHPVHSVAAHLAVDCILATGRGWAPLVFRDSVSPPAVGPASRGNPRRRHFAEGLAWALSQDGIGATPWCRRGALVAGGMTPGDVLHALHHLATADAHTALQPERRPC